VYVIFIDLDTTGSHTSTFPQLATAADNSKMNNVVDSFIFMFFSFVNFNCLDPEVRARL
jgi:hypothetical protein